MDLMQAPSPTSYGPVRARRRELLDAPVRGRRRGRLDAPVRALRRGLLAGFALCLFAAPALAGDVKGYLGDVNAFRKTINVDNEDYAVPVTASLYDDAGRGIDLRDIDRIADEVAASDDDISILCTMTTRSAPGGGPDEVISLRIELEEG